MRIVSSDLSNGSIQSLVSALTNDVQDCEALNGALDDFIGVIDAKESLDGVSYQAVKGKLASYKEIVKQRKQIATDLASAIRASINYMTSYMGEYEYLDDTELPTIKQKHALAVNESNYLVSLRFQDSEDYNEMNIGDTEISLGEINRRLSELNTLMQDLDKKIKKLEGLPGADSSAFSNVSGVSMTSFSSNVGGMTPIQVNFTIEA